MIYITLCAFITVSILVVHMNYSASPRAELASPLSFTDLIPAKADPAATALVWLPVSAIEM